MNPKRALQFYFPRGCRDVGDSAFVLHFKKLYNYIVVVLLTLTVRTASKINIYGKPSMILHLKII